MISPGRMVDVDTMAYSTDGLTPPPPPPAGEACLAPGMAPGSKTSREEAGMSCARDLRSDAAVT